MATWFLWRVKGEMHTWAISVFNLKAPIPWNVPWLTQLSPTSALQCVGSIEYCLKRFPKYQANHHFSHHYYWTVITIHILPCNGNHDSDVCVWALGKRTWPFTFILHGHILVMHPSSEHISKRLRSDSPRPDFRVLKKSATIRLKIRSGSTW